MAKREHLFDLISTLSTSEKKQYRLIHSKSRKSKHMLLFDALDKMEEYDNNRLKRAVNETSSAKLAQLKQRTQDLLVDFLMRQRSNEEPDDQIQDYYQKAALFLERELTYRSVQLYLRGIGMARELYDDVLLLEGLLRIRMIRGRWLETDTLPGIEEIQEDMVAAADRLSELTRLRQMHFRYHKLTTADQSEIPEAQLKEYKAELESNWMQTALRSENIRNRIVALSILALHAASNKDYDQRFEFYSQAYELSKQAKLENRGHTSTRISLLSNTINAAYQAYRIKSMGQYLADLEVADLHGSTAKAKRLESFHYSTVGFHNMTGQQIKTELYKAIRSGQLESTRNPVFKLAIDLKLGMYHLIHAELKQSAALIETCLNSTLLGKHSQYKSMAFCLRLILHLEEEEYDLADTLIRNRERQIRNTDHTHDWEISVMEHFKMLFKRPRSAWREIFSELAEVQEAFRTEKRVDTLADIASWARAKADGMLLREVIEAKVYRD